MLVNKSSLPFSLKYTSISQNLHFYLEMTEMEIIFQLLHQVSFYPLHLPPICVFCRPMFIDRSKQTLLLAF